LLTLGPFTGIASNVAGIVIPCFNASNTLSRAIDSVIGQSYQDWRLIVVDDGSHDESLEIARGYESIYPDKVAVISSPNQGACSARLIGVANTVSEYIAFLDADDYWDQSKLQIQLDYLEADPDLHGVTTGFLLERFLLKSLSSRRTFSWSWDEMVGWTMSGSKAPALNSTLMMRRDAYVRIGGHDPELGSHADDLDLGWRIFSRTKVLGIPSSVVTLGSSPSQVHREVKKMTNARIRVIGRVRDLDSDLAERALRFVNVSYEVRSIVSTLGLKSALSLAEYCLRNPRTVAWYLLVLLGMKH